MGTVNSQKGKGKIRTYFVRPVKEIPEKEEIALRKRVEGAKRRSNFSHYFEKPKVEPSMSITDPPVLHPPDMNIFFLYFTNPIYEKVR
jgi:hypothetical protein